MLHLRECSCSIETMTAKKAAAKKPAKPKYRANLVIATKAGKMVPVGGQVSADEVDDFEYRLTAGILTEVKDG